MTKILVLNFFPAFYPPGSGGELRYYNLYNHLSKYYDITLLSPTFAEHPMELIEHSGSFREHRVPKGDIFNELHWKLNQQNLCSEVSALVCALSSEHPNLYHDKYLELYTDCDIIIHESPYMLRYDLFFGVDDKPRIYNSYNYESDLMSQMWSGNYADEYIKLIRKLEGELVQKCDLVFATCDDDRRRFIADFCVDKTKIKLAPNGINPEEYTMRDTDNATFDVNTVLFIGSAHPPNIEAAEFIIRSVADKCKDITFKIAGSCCKSLDAIEKPNVDLLGFVSQEEKEDLFRSCKCAINPMFSGSGTNLKTLEFFSAGIPMLSTETGVRGLGVVDGEHYCSASESNFAEKLCELLENPDNMNNIAVAGREHVNSLYSWEKIAENVHNDIEKLPHKAHVPTLLLLNDFSVADPKGGGEVRINNLYRNISYKYKVIHLCLNGETRLLYNLITPMFLEISIPKTAEHIAEQQKMDSRHVASSADIVSSYMCKKNHLLKEVFDIIMMFADAVILIHPYMSELVEERTDKPIIYESLNYEPKLKKELLTGHPDYEFLINKAVNSEKRAINLSNLVITCSKDEMYEEFNKPVFVVENGVEIPVIQRKLDMDALKTKFNGHPIAVFVGSGHTPNVEATQFIINSLAKNMPHIYFMLIGGVCGAFDYHTLPDNVVAMGMVSDLVKSTLMRLADIAINPMCSGFGSNLKLADYFSNRVPTVTTPIGTRGYSIENSKHALVCELDGFSEAIDKILSDSEFAANLTESAFSYVFSTLDWRFLANKYVNIIDTHIFERRKKKLLFITYRVNVPEKGGAEVYLSNVLRNMDTEKVGYLDIAALNISEIYNNKHFSNTYTYDSDLYQDIYPDKQIYKFNVDSHPQDIVDRDCRELYALFREEARQLSLQFLSKYSQPILLGGWYYPEKSKDGTRIWSSSKALIYCKGASSITVHGRTPNNKELILIQDGANQTRHMVEGEFSVSIELNKSAQVLEIQTAPFTTFDDVRELGILVSQIKYKIDNNEHQLSLATDYKEFLSDNYVDEYINAYIDNARKREKRYDELFRKTRGPNSKELEQWLDLHISRYDAVLVHNVPFGTTLAGAKYAQKHNVPYVALPHFHFTDDFYHWDCYYELFRSASAVVTAPKASEELFYKKITGDNLVSLPGGGINPNEYADIDLTKFDTLYANELPFVLCLGRKDGAKHYADIICAVEKINKDGRKVNLLMIGPDNDGVDISERDVIYLGKQPREVVLGALSKCLAVANMSSSESFGIVILEAWSVKKPAIVNINCPAFVELVEHGKTGLTCSRNDLAENILHLLSNPADCEKMGEMGYRQLQERYTWRKIAESFEKLINVVA
jgi:glycosyltransferase involved in cell wall biosynthesis